jgi:hypothetical protein
MVHGPWSMVHGLYSMLYALRSIAHGHLHGKVAHAVETAAELFQVGFAAAAETCPIHRHTIESQCAALCRSARLIGGTERDRSVREGRLMPRGAFQELLLFSSDGELGACRDGRWPMADGRWPST